MTAVSAVAAFLIGSIPFGVIVSRLFFGRDIRTAGSGNIGAANALRSLGAKGGAAVLVLDALKGFLPVYAAIRLQFTPSAVCIIALAAVLGHCFSPWLNGRGGKGVATYLGTLFALSWPAALFFIAVWLVVFRVGGFASLASLWACALSPVALYVAPRRWEAVVYGIAAASIIAWKHRENIVRLRSGTESKLNVRRNA